MAIVIFSSAFIPSVTVFAEKNNIDNEIQNAYNENTISNAQPQKVASSATIATPFIIVLVRKTPEFFGEVTSVLFVSMSVNILSTSGFFCKVRSKNGTEGYVFKGWLNDGSPDFSLNRYYDHVYVDDNNLDSEGNIRTYAIYDGDKSNIRWMSDNPEIVSVDEKTGLMEGKSPGVTKIHAKMGLTGDVTCEVACISRWKETEVATTTKAVTIYRLPGRGEMSTFPKGTIVTALGDFIDGSGWIYATANKVWGFIKLDDFPGIDYLYTEYHYYDEGYQLRFGSADTKIHTYASVMNDIMIDLFKLKINPRVYSYISPADSCKKLQFNSVSTNNLSSSCPKIDGHNKASCLTTSVLRSALYNDSDIGPGNDHMANTIWTGHIMNGHAMSNSQRNPTYILVFTTGNTVYNNSYTNKSDYMIRSRSIYELIHETCHQFELTDHYCKKDGVPCSNPYCYRCSRNETPPFCIMNAVIDPENYSNDKLFCTECTNKIKSHLSSHH